MKIRKGFTFLEMLVVALVIGIIASTSVFAQYNTPIYTEQGGAKRVFSSGGELELQSGSILDIQAGTTFTNAAAIVQSGVMTQTGNAYFGAANYKSTMTASSGAWAITGPITANGGLSGTTGAFSSTLDVNGNLTLGADNYVSTFTASSGAQAWTGAATFNGGLISTTAAFTGAVTHTAASVTVSTSATSSQSICLVGAVEALPASGYAKNCLAVLTSDNALYISTEAPAGDQSWIKVGAQ